ncbi:uncharacterized protein LOC111920661 [Lactuca sativa]|uniref:uncharacterized protein LOC111920661 n=1 Tax=Lactuca sativa TaxID=4236 RepID=UPI0022AE9AEB|nr:uncharacterized protein LOC111920661 [Lactuca sativa]
MANQGAKKRRDENTRHMNNLFRIIIACNVVYILLRAGVFYSSFTWLHWIGLILTSSAYYLCYTQLASMAKPTYSDNGDLFDGGFDMSTGGACGYLHDVIYITCFVQLTSIISGKFWWIYAVIPGFAVYKGWGLIKGFLPQGGSEGVEEDEKTRKKREKMEKKASRGKFVKAKAR